MNRRIRRVAQVCNEIAEKKTTLENAIEIYNLTKTEQSEIDAVMKRVMRLRLGMGGNKASVPSLG